ncbi:ovalbumin isoform X1 [Numida meleagris]|uniref:ovalbumin isoform X1 n=2 Tax=Numida meleagris TaxID=8996 RepID=UPI000B3D7FEC|nr:ovalbumin isoform X1 [Numida meleagris]
MALCKAFHPYIFIVLLFDVDNSAFTMASIGAVSTEFCVDVYKELRVHHANENIFYSPFTIISTLAMVYLGAKDSTRTQINKVVRFDKLPGFGDSIEAQCGTSVNVHSSLRDILNQITKPNDVYSFSLASRLYAEETYPILPEYLQCVKELYRGGLESINFQTAADQARELINSWVESQTSGIIKNVLQPSSVNSQTAMVLVNAIYFKGLWERAFKDEDTQAIPFRVTEQESKPVQMMSQIGSFKVASVASEKVKILELPFVSGTMSMLVLLPDEVSGLEQLESTISTEKLTEWTSSSIMEERKIKVFLPRMRMEEKYNLTSVLMAMGMTDLFSSSANLSGISSAESLKISQAVHAAYAEIYEAGREVVSSAEAGVDATSVSEEFRVDHPFLLCIKHNPTNSILFFGRCISP